MPKKRKETAGAASPWSTGSGGATVEIKVGAYFLAAMLTGDRVLAPSLAHVVTGIDWQIRDKGWLLDDLLLCLRDGNTGGSLALSVKSNQQISQAGFPEDFVLAVWSHWLQKDTNVFEKERDYLGLAVARLNTKVYDAWNDLFQEATQTGDDPERIAQRLGAGKQSNEIIRRLFQSLHCPPALGTAGPAETVRLISRLQVLHLDFRNANSRSSQHALRMCQEASEGHDSETARNLWKSLCALVSEKNSAGGSLRSLPPALRAEFRLLGALDDRADWQRLERSSQAGQERTRDSLTSGIVISRSLTSQEIEAQLLERQSVLVSGESGAGKSALAKSISRSWQAGSVVWLDPVGAEAEDLIALERKIGLRKPLHELLPLSPRKLSLLVLDALERWSPRGLDCAARLINICSTSDAWVILATARSDQQRWVLDELSSREAPINGWSLYPLELPSLNDLQEVWSRFPDLHRLLLRHPRMEGLLRNLKVLDWLTRGKTAEAASWSAPSQLVDGLWRRWTNSGPNPYGKENVLQKIARLEADSMEASVALSALDVSEAVVLKELEGEELIRVEEGRVSFRHDLTGDWARLRSLVAEGPGALRQKIPELALSPHWYSALRFFGQRLLEKGDSGAREWLDLYEALPEGVDSSTVARDLLLDSLIFASTSEQLLEGLWPHLAGGDGGLLSRLLNRFLFVATKPHPKVAAWRIPHSPLWGPILETLDHHRSDVAAQAPVPGAEICFLWLNTRQNQMWRGEAARTALEIANAHPDSERAIIFEAVLLAASELPEEVIELALRLARRSEPPPTPQDHEEPVADEAPLILHGRAGRIRPPYPDGPRARIGRGFREAVLGSASLRRLIDARPAIAREVLLACCLQEPRWVPFFGDRYVYDVPGVYEWLEGFPPAYSKGPFLWFLKLQREEGLEAILRLVNQATANWKEERETHRRRPPGLLATKRRRWAGDGEVYRWNEHSSNVLQTALTALETWLVDEVEQGRSIEPAIRTIFKRSRSAAFAGVLVCLGKKRPELFEGPLLPLLGLRRLYRWEPFTGLLLIAIQLVLSRRFDDQFAGFRLSWSNKLRSADPVDREDIERLIARLDPDNYQLRPRPDGAVEVSFEWPEPLREPSERGLAVVLPSIHASSLTHQSHRLLEKAEALELEEGETLWNELLRIESIKERLRPEKYADAMTGAIATLLLLPGEWGGEHPDRVVECKRLFFEIFAEVPPADDIGHSATLIKEHWPGFAAETAVALLAEEPTDPRARHLTAMAVMSRWHKAETTGTAMTRGFRERERLGDDWGRMQNLAVLWAALKSMGHHLDREENSLPHRWASRLSGWFVQARLPSQPLDWQKVAEVSRSLRVRFHRKEEAALEDKFAHPSYRPVTLTSSGFERHALKAAFAWLPNWEAKGARERDAWLALHRRLLHVALEPCLAVAQLAPTERWRDGLMSEYEGWVLKRIAALIPRLSTPAERRSFWEPLFSPGVVARDLVAIFLREWFYSGPPGSESPDQFVRCWEEIIHYAVAEGHGAVDDSGWIFLMGLHWQGPAEYRKAVGRLLPLYRDWAGRHLSGERTAKQFARFLGAPAAFDLVPSGIAWLTAALPSFRDSHESSLDEEIVNLLRAAWKRTAPDPTLRSPIQELFAWVVQRATPAALALQEEIRR
jgi:hypothetical protein